ncbi:hypothetical protein TNCV_609471 [Trichonephila clavipes]|nr:hypothetical protein TNCV_609471 [Trichonephila clavipes]
MSLNSVRFKKNPLVWKPIVELDAPELMDFGRKNDYHTNRKENCTFRDKQKISPSCDEVGNLVDTDPSKPPRRRAKKKKKKLRGFIFLKQHIGIPVMDENVF